MNFLFTNEIYEQAKIAGPTTIGLLFYKVPWMISLYFLGNLGAKELAAGALATTLFNVTGMSLSVGLCSALVTLTGQAKGDLISKSKHEVQHDDDEETEESSSLLGKTNGTNYQTEIEQYNNDSVDIDQAPIAPLIYLYRGIVVQFAFLLPVGIIWLNGIDPFLMKLGQSRELAEMTSTYLQVLTIGLWSYSINYTLMCWLQSISIADVPAYVVSIGLLLHIPCNILFVKVLNMGYLGVALATIVFQMIQPFMIVSIVFGTRRGRRRILKGMGTMEGTKLSFWKEFKLAIFSFKGIQQYLSLALPGILVISEWWASEVVVFLSGKLEPNPDYALSAMSIYQTINTFFFQIPLGFSASASARVGMFLGMNEAKNAKIASQVSIFSAAVLSMLMGSILMLTPHHVFPSLFTPNKNVIDMAASTIPFLAFYVFADGLQVVLNGVIKGCGRQATAMPIVIFAYWCVGVPLAYYNSFTSYEGTTDCPSNTWSFCGVRGLVSAMTIGTWTHFLLLLVVVLYSIRWDRETQLAQQRLQKGH